MELVFLKQLEASYFLQAPTSDFGVAKIKWRVIDKKLIRRKAISTLFSFFFLFEGRNRGMELRKKINSVKLQQVAVAYIEVTESSSQHGIFYKVFLFQGQLFTLNPVSCYQSIDCTEIIY